MLNKFKENKKIMEIKMDQASKMADEAAHEFIDSIHALVKDASEEDLKKFLQAEDDMIELEDKLAVIAAFADIIHDDIGGVAQSLVLAESKSDGCAYDCPCNICHDIVHGYDCRQGH